MLGKFRWNQVHTKLLKLIILSGLIHLGYAGCTGAYIKARYWRGRKKDESRNVISIHQELQRTDREAKETQE